MNHKAALLTLRTVAAIAAGIAATTIVVWKLCDWAGPWPVAAIGSAMFISMTVVGLYRSYKREIERGER